MVNRIYNRELQVKCLHPSSLANTTQPVQSCFCVSLCYYIWCPFWFDAQPMTRTINNGCTSANLNGFTLTPRTPVWWIALLLIMYWLIVCVIQAFAIRSPILLRVLTLCCAMGSVIRAFRKSCGSLLTNAACYSWKVSEPFEISWRSICVHSFHPHLYLNRMHIGTFKAEVRWF